MKGMRSGYRLLCYFLYIELLTIILFSPNIGYDWFTFAV